MRMLLSWGGAALITAALLDPMIQSGLERPIPWAKDLLMGAAGICCIYLQIKYRRKL